MDDRGLGSDTGNTRAERPRALGVRSAAGLILLAGILAYANSFAGAFIFDDANSISENPYIRSLWPLHQAMFAPLQATVAGRPIVCLSLAVNYALGGLNPWGYHAFNLAVHLLAGLLLFGIVRRTLSRPLLAERFGRPAPILAMLTAMLWVVHPLQTESVTYIVQRTESMMGLFYLLTLYCFIRGAAGGRRVLWYAAAILSCTLGMATKEVMVTAPVIVLLYDAAFAAGSFRQALRSRPAFYAGLAATWIILAVIMVGAPRSETVGFSAGVSPIDYAMNQCLTVIHYIKQAFWPHPLILDYGAAVRLSLRTVLPHAAILALLLATTAVALIRRPMLGFLGAWFFVILAPTSSFVPIATEVAAERRMYLPLAGIITLVVIAAHALVRTASARWPAALRLRSWAAVVLGCAVAGALGLLTHERNGAYADPVELWRQTAAAKPRNPRAYIGLGDALLTAGRKEESLACYRRVSAMAPRSIVFRCCLAAALWKSGRLQEAVDIYQQVLREAPKNREAHVNLGRILAELGRFDEAVPHYEEVLQTSPGREDAVAVLHHLAEALTYTGHEDQAIARWRQVLTLAPAYSVAHNNLAALLAHQGHWDQAVSHLSEAVRLDAGYTDARRNLGRAFMRQGRINEAIRELREVLRTNPNDPQAQVWLDEALEKEGGTPSGTTRTMRVGP